MRDSLPEWMSDLLWRGAGATFVISVALFCGRYVEESAQARHMRRMAAMTPHRIMQLSADPVAFDAADLALPQSRLPQMACTPALTLEAKPGAMLVVTLDAPCAANERVEITHAGMQFTARMPIGRPLHLAFPGLEAQGRVTIAMPDGTETQAAAPLPDLDVYHRFAVTWTGHAGFQLQGQEGPVEVSAEDPGAGPDSAAGWLATLGDGDLVVPDMAQVYTYPVDGAAEVTAFVTSSPDLCGRSLVGQTISSRGGEAEATVLRVDLPDCLMGPVVMPLKNLDQEMKLALR